MPPRPEPVTAASLLAGARELADALSILAERPTQAPIRASAILGAHCVELALKAFLLAQGWTDDAVRENLRHNLAQAWKEAAAAGLEISQAAPPWCELLASAHDYPYVGRYPPRNSGLVAPSPRDIVARTGELIALVDRALGAA